ncbi:hypothetical protein [Desulfitibacter alkalitolerans]|uniref:hypothetical protein n=1 Tax=Desulfitibacter alkalitolerans TaxID=264641 RepID=UPI0012EBF541|nr:hypothetical protein [Desulfitibacter alkalitolerans]
MVYSQPENASSSFKCANCGTMFSLTENKSGECPICGYHCSEDNCSMVDASDEDY